MEKRSEIEIRYSKLEARLALIEGRDCDEYDYLIAAFCGVAAGLIDSFFVGKPNFGEETGNSVLGTKVDEASDKIVETIADKLIARDTSKCNNIASKLNSEGIGKREFRQKMREALKSTGIPDNFSFSVEGEPGSFRIVPNYTEFKGNGSKLVYLENKFRVSYDQSTSDKLSDTLPFSITPDNHHMKSMAHWPDLIGLVFAILDQFTEKTTFIDNGRIVRATPSSSVPTLRGRTIPEKLFFGFVNWFGHLLSDYCGSHSSKGRGDGIPIPFFGLFSECDFGNFCASDSKEDGMSLADLALKTYEQGYDARFGITLSIPVLIQNLMTRFLWSLKAHFVHKKPWNECIPTDTHKDLRAMLLTGNATLCAIDIADAGIRSGGNMLEFALHLNVIAWYKLAKNSLKEICIRFDFTYEDLKTQYEYLDFKLNQYIDHLKAIDYASYEAQLADLNSIADLLESEDWENAARSLDEFIEKHHIQTQIKNIDDFKEKLTTKDFVFKIGE